MPKHARKGGSSPSLAGAVHVHPFGKKNSTFGANKTDRKYGRLDRNCKARSGTWIFCFTNLFLFCQLIFVVKFFVAAFASMHFLRRQFFLSLKLEIFVNPKKAQYGRTSLVTSVIFRIIHELGTRHVYVEKFGKHEAKFLDHQFEVPQNERRFLCLFCINSVCAWKSRFPIQKKGPNPCSMSGTVRSNGGCNIWAYLVSPSIIYCKSYFFLTRMDGNHFGVVNGHRNHSNPPYLVFHSIGTVLEKTCFLNFMAWHDPPRVFGLHGSHPSRLKPGDFRVRCSFLSDTSTG